MTKQEQIEGMAKIVDEVLDVWNKNNGHRYEVEE